MTLPHRHCIAILAVLAAVGCQDAGEADDDSATAVDCSDRALEVPSPRGEAAGIWDPDKARLVLFGGDEGTPVNCSSQTDFVGQTWAFHTDCDTFEDLRPGDGPHARGRHAAAHDAARGRMVIHGGRYRAGTSGQYSLFDDAWAFDLLDDTWSLLAEGGPSARSNHSAVVLGDRLVVYGGSTSTDGLSYSPRSDVWALDLAGGGGWSEIGVAGGGPGERLFHAAAASDDGRTMYVYGGGDENAFVGPFFGDLWAFDVQAGAWTELHDGRGDAPAARIWASLVHDPAGGRLLLFGGHDDGELGNTNELWEFRLGEGAWSRLVRGDVLQSGAAGFCDFPADFVDPDLDAPERRNAAVVALTGDREVIAFGGKSDCGLLNDVWAWSSESGAWAERSPATAGEICLRSYAECSTMCY